MKALIMTLVLCAALLHAERAGPYVAAAYGKGVYDSNGRLESLRQDDIKNSMRLTLGAYINENLSVEVDYTLYETFKAVYNQEHVREHFALIGACAVPHYPLYNDTIDLFGRIGAGQINWDETGDHTNRSDAGAYVLGAGVGYRMLSTLMFKVGYELNLFEMQDTNTGISHDMRLDYYYAGIEVTF